MTPGQRRIIQYYRPYPYSSWYAELQEWRPRRWWFGSRWVSLDKWTGTKDKSYHDAVSHSGDVYDGYGRTVEWESL